MTVRRRPWLGPPAWRRSGTAPRGTPAHLVFRYRVLVLLASSRCRSHSRCRASCRSDDSEGRGGDRRSSRRAFGPTVGSVRHEPRSTDGRAGVVHLLAQVRRSGGSAFPVVRSFVLIGIPIIVILGNVSWSPGAIASFDPILGTLLVAYPLGLRDHVLPRLGHWVRSRGGAASRCRGCRSATGPLWGMRVPRSHVGMLWHFPLLPGAGCGRLQRHLREHGHVPSS